MKNGKFLSETFRIRVAPSLTTLKLIHDSPVGYHSQTGALIVGNPEVGEVQFNGQPPRHYSRRKRNISTYYFSSKVSLPKSFQHTKAFTRLHAEAVPFSA